jgi:hypothetical protein
MVKRAAPIAGTAKNTDHDFLFRDTRRSDHVGLQKSPHILGSSAVFGETILD